MVSWTTALKKAAVYIGLIIIWTIIGGVIFGIGLLIGGFTIKGMPLSGLLEQFGIDIPINITIPLPYMANPLAFIAFVVIGYVVVLLGMMATFFKIVAEITADEVERRLKKSSS
ncbi:MAG: hypothetical protein RMJ14_04825 [Nitrososphaerota archaeon]|nr:hypothetical protein [Aigarchaeota archaeon]MDW8076943.1 hypothetical protein [Nitrososphaerota archaeon]